MPSPLGDYFSIIVLWDTEEVVIVYTIVIGHMVISHFFVFSLMFLC
jgi:hypothetical protein